MKIKSLYFLWTMAFFLNQSLFGGFSGDTPVKMKDCYKRIDQIKVGDKVICYNLKDACNTEKKVVAKKSRKVKNLICIIAGHRKLITAKKQKFYLPEEKKWKKAKNLRPGDKIQKGLKEAIVVSKTKKIDGKVELFDLSIEEEHNFRVSEDEILAHNFAAGIDIAYLLSLGLWEAAKYLATTIGIAAAYSILDELGLGKLRWFLGFLKEPGKPTETDGVKPPKKWDGKKVKNPNGHGAGYPDNKGNVWVPTGEGGHGGAHWDVQNPKTGKHTNVNPGGGVRGSDNRK